MPATRGHGPVDGLAAELRALLPERAWLPGDTGFAEVASAWNTHYAQHPVAVVAPRDADEIAAVVRISRRYGVPVAPRSGGHAPTAAQDGTILLRTGALRGVVVDERRRTARVAAGSKWREVLEALDGTGLLAMSGSNGDVSVVGYLLGGGMSWFGRARGFACRSVRSFDVVDAAGVARTVDARTDPDLFWALRGGGGDFAVVTAVEIELFQADQLYAGALHWWGERLDEVLAAYLAATRAAPDELTLWTWFARYPDVEAVPEPVRGKAFVTVQWTYLGAGSDAEAHLAPLRAVPGPFQDTTGYLVPSRLPTVSGEPDDPRPAMDWSRLVGDIDETFLSTLVKLTGPDSGSPLIMCLRHLGGAFATATDADGAAGAIDHEYLLLAFGSPTAPGVADRVADHWATLEREFAGYFDGDRTQHNMLGYDHRAARAFPPATLDRLRELKRRYDPANVVRGNRPVLDPGTAAAPEQTATPSQTDIPS